MFVTHLQCSKCQEKYQSEEVIHLCKCGSPLLVCYDMEKVKAALTKDKLSERREDLWRYAELLPVKNAGNIVSLGETMTPLLRLDTLGSEISLTNLYMKDEGILPTGTFKDRGAAMGVSKAKELGVNTLIMPTNGNAGAAWASYAARAGLRAVIVMPKDAPLINRIEITVTGASLFLVEGTISDAGKIVRRAVDKFGWFDASTLKEPYRIEGKKTIGLELAEQFDWVPPDVIIYPTGGGVGLIGIHKAMQELQQISWISGKLPRMVAVQSTGCAPIVRAWDQKKNESTAWENPHTVAFGITVPKALGDALVLKAIYETNGYAIAVNDEDILAAHSMIASREGRFICPEGAATLAGTLKLAKSGWIKPDEKVVMINTGTGLKYPQVFNVEPPVLMPDDDLMAEGTNKCPQG
jgi:threonine synthase